MSVATGRLVQGAIVYGTPGGTNLFIRQESTLVGMYWMGLRFYGYHPSCFAVSFKLVRPLSSRHGGEMACICPLVCYNEARAISFIRLNTASLSSLGTAHRWSNMALDTFLDCRWCASSRGLLRLFVFCLLLGLQIGPRLHCVLTFSRIDCSPVGTVPPWIP